ncbi:ribonuclease H-like protein [Myriangium duriaei CBS 260.36]|uniref:Ribonuclease n=1 Tax=Myriangium duriaei CBS 260.36 TaxID=1168546 RepID=A0A9P4J8Q9_9PEZI|nr:ribonuclease H-like protein [Myriangium duriaei CBS 260.36]
MEDVPDLAQETPPEDVFIAPSIDRQRILDGESYSHFSEVPSLIAGDKSIEVVLGVDEAGRGPVLGPMVYGIYYLPITQHRSLLADTHHFDDSKVLTATVRSQLMEKVCTPGTDLYTSCGWATRVMSARDISSNQLKPVGMYNLNAQAMDATIDLIQRVFDMGVNVKEIFVDTIGPPATYQAKLARIFPTAKVTVAKKADSLYPSVSAASVCAKVTRDAALEVCYEAYQSGESSAAGWGSGYPSDARCSGWMRSNMNPLFGWGAECRFSWSTAKDMLDAKGGVKVRWPAPDDGDNMKLTDFAMYANDSPSGPDGELASWYGSSVTEQVF